MRRRQDRRDRQCTMGRAHCWAWSLPPSPHKVTTRRSRTRLLLLQPLGRLQSDPAREGMETLISRCAGPARVRARVRVGAGVRVRVRARVWAGVRAGVQARVQARARAGAQARVLACTCGARGRVRGYVS